MIAAIMVIVVLVVLLLAAVIAFLRSKQLDGMRQRYLAQENKKQADLAPRNPWDPGYRREWK
jgi:flagellar basal body-associated protein FliL